MKRGISIRVILIALIGAMAAATLVLAVIAALDARNRQIAILQAAGSNDFPLDGTVAWVRERGLVAVAQMAEMTQRNGAMVEETSASAQALSD